MESAKSTYQNLNYKEYYTRIIKGDVEKVLNELTLKISQFSSELQSFQAYVYNVNRQNMKGLMTSEAYNVSYNQITHALINFLDELSNGNGDLACKHLNIRSESRTAFDEIIDAQLEFSQNSIHENKRFRTAVSLLFITAILFSIFVAFKHIDFLKNEFNIFALFGVNVVLYFFLGVLAIYALSLIIRGSTYNQYYLNFSKKSIKH